MAKLTLQDHSSLTNEQSALNLLNQNSAATETALENTLSRDGTSPNQMEADLDMNSNSILNLPSPASATEPLRLQDLSDFLGSGEVVSGIGGPATSTDNAIVRWDGTAGNDIQNSGVTIDDTGNLLPTTDDDKTLGSASLQWSNLFIGTGGGVNFGNGDIAITNTTTNTLNFTGAANGYNFDITILPLTNDSAALGTGTRSWADLFLASGGVISWNNSDVTINHFTNLLSFVGATAGYAFDAAVYPATNDIAALGSNTFSWSDLFLASGGTINFNNGNVLISHAANLLGFAGAANGYTFSHGILPSVNDGASLGSTGNQWSDLFLASGGVINWNNGDVTITNNGASQLTFLGGSNGYLFDSVVGPQTNDSAALGNTANQWSDLFLASGGVINWDSGDVLITHAANALSFIGGDVIVRSDIAIPAGGSTSARLLMSSTAGFGVYCGSGVPTVSAAQGSIYLRSDGSSTSTRLYVNTNGTTGWTNFTSAT